MGTAHAVEQKIENPGVLRSTGNLNLVFGGLILIGIISFFIMFSNDHTHAWTAILRSHFYFMGISVLALFFIVIEWITTAMWSAPMKRLAEGFTAYLPFALVSTVIMFFGAKTLFKWTDLAYVNSDPVVLGKAGYLNLNFFMIRTLIAVGMWIFFAKKIVGGSLKADTGANYKEIYNSNRKYGIAFVIFFALSFSMSAFDQLMSLDPHFFSTMFGVYTFAGMYQTFFSMLAIVTILMKRAGYLDKLINENHMHDIGKMMFTFTVFWAYTGFSQYMLIWYANLPEETGYFITRFNHGWEGWTFGLFIAKFIIPFMILLPRGNKRSETIIFLTACWILVTEYLDLNWMIQPQFYENGPLISIGDIGVWLGFLGVFGTLVMRFYRKHNVVAIKDPYLPDSVFHHHVQ